MKLLGIESSGMVAGVACWCDGVITAEYTTDFKQTHSQTLLPMLEEVVRRIQLDLQTVDAIAVSGGPGSFTGLRIGSATAKGLGLALEKPLVHVPTLDAMAYQCFGFEGVVCPMLDARRNQVFAGLYRTGITEDSFACRLPAFAEDIDILLARLAQDYPAARGSRLAFLGDGALLHREKIQNVCTNAVFMPEFMNKQRAAAVAALGARMYCAGQAENAAEHKPDYLRVSQAEREREERLRRAAETEG